MSRRQHAPNKRCALNNDGAPDNPILQCFFKFYAGVISNISWSEIYSIPFHCIFSAYKNTIGELVEIACHIPLPLL